MAQQLQFHGQEHTTMKCYFHGSNLAEDKLDRRQGVISFSIPDYGVIFRAQHFGNTYECEYAAALALIRFLHLNKEHFKATRARLLTDSAMVVYQAKGRVSTPKRLKRLRDLLLFHKRKLGFELEWVPTGMNRAKMQSSGAATNTKTPQFNYDIFEDSKRRGVLRNRSGFQSRMT
jgi:hypothetical protein